MQLNTEKRDDISIITIEDESLEAMNSQEFKEEMSKILPDCRKVVLNLAHTDFVDSSGCGALLSCLRQLNAAGGDLKLCNVQRPVRTLFELVRMDRIVEIHNSCEEAVDSFK
ncbi:MAG: STAS domain-containing protein [Candidatus Sumerlaeota bacterium]